MNLAKINLITGIRGHFRPTIIVGVVSLSILGGALPIQSVNAQEKGSLTPPFPELAPLTEGGGIAAANKRLIVKTKSSFWGGYQESLVRLPNVEKITPLLNANAFFSKPDTDLELSRVLVMEFASSDDAINAKNILSNDTSIEYIEVSGVYYAVNTPNDPSFTQQWALNNTGQTGGTPDADIDAPEAWDTTTGSSDIVLAVVDTGVDSNHKDLKGKVMKGYDFVNNDSDPMDDHGHGTHVAGIAAAKSNDGIGIAGVCWECRVMPVKVLTSGGWGYWEWIAQGIVYAAFNGADVINLSLGGSTDSKVLHDAVKDARNAGVAVIAATGNSHSTPVLYPARYSETIAVAATDHNDERASFSSYGPEVDIAAPGVSILSSLPGDKYAKWSGTSMATPHVTGAAGILLSVSKVSPEELRNCLRESADDKGTPGWDEYYGAGRLNVKVLLECGGQSSCGGEACTLVGTEAADNLSGTEGDDVICGKGGDDLILGNGGDDLICGDDGNDFIDGGSGVNVISGGKGNDHLEGGNQNDWLMGDAGNDSLYGKGGSDLLEGHGGNDTIYGNAGNDFLDGGAGYDYINGGAGTEDECINGEAVEDCERASNAMP